MIKRIFLRRELAEKMMAKASRMRQKPDCGVLFGKIIKDTALIDTLVDIPNIAREWHQHININKVERKSLINSYEEKGLEYIADFHTHRKICKVTTIDKYAIENIFGETIWVIATPENVRAYKIVHSQEESVDYPEIPLFLTRQAGDNRAINVGIQTTVS